MYDFKNVSDQELHSKMLNTSQKERQLTADMISMIEEAGRRKFFLDLGYATLFDYLTLGLHYSAGAAMRRISAARIAQEVPEVKERILDGSLSLSNLSQAEQFFRNERKHSQGLSSDEKREVLKQLENKSTRQTEKTLVALSSVPQQLMEDKVKPLTPELTQITFKASAEFMAQLEEARGLLAHKMPEATLSEIMAELMSLALPGLRKRKFKTAEVEEIRASQLESTDPADSKEKSANSKSAESGETQVVGSGAGNTADYRLLFPRHELKEASRYIPASVRREVYQRDQGRCAVVNPITKKICGNRFKVEMDHFPIPWAMGGPSTASNLRLACASCNRLHAIHRYGRGKIVNRRMPYGKTSKI